MVHRYGVVLHAHLHAARDSHLVGVYLRTHAVLDAGLQYAGGVLDGEEALVAEDVYEVRQPLVRHARYHLVDDQVHIILLVAAILHRYAVGAEEVGLDGHGRGLLQAAYDAQQLKLALSGEAVAALDLDGAGTHAHHAVEALQRHVVELVLRGRRRGLGRVEDTASPLGNLLVAEPAYLVHKLMLARVGIDDVRVGVAERRHHHPSCGIDHAVGIHLLQLAHRPKSLYLAVLYEQVRILDGLQLSHLLALLAQLR